MTLIAAALRRVTAEVDPENIVRTVNIGDGFLSDRLAPTPLAVVEAADALSEAQVRHIAGELNQAETTHAGKIAEPADSAFSYSVCSGTRAAITSR